MDDSQIIHEMRQGNEEVVKYLYSHLIMVTSWVKKNSGTEDDALDLFQEALIVFCKNVRSGKYEYRAKISTYLFKICKNRWRKHLENMKGKNGGDLGSMNVEDDNSTMLEEFDEEKSEQRLKDYVSKCLEKLGEPCKTILWRSIVDKIKMEEIAVELGYKDAHSVRQQKYRCLLRFRGFSSYEIIIGLI
jgi:RNA polymerase sigma factor (sigma-70 family)